MHVEKDIAASRRPKPPALKWLLRALLALALLLGLSLGGGLLWLRSQNAVDYALEQLPGLLSGAGLNINIESAEGPLPQHLLLQGIIVSDTHGPWLKIKELELRVAVWSLLHGMARFELIRIDAPELLRLPDLPAQGERAEPETDSVRPSLLMPVAVELDDLSLNNASLAWSALGFSADNPPPPGVELNQPLQLTLAAKGSLENGLARAQAELTAVVGPDLEARLSLPNLGLNLAGTGEDSITAEALLSVKSGPNTNELTLSLQAEDDGVRLALSRCAVQGMGLTISGDGVWQRNTDALNARFTLNSAEQASWQELAAELGGVDKQLLAALADPLALKVTLNGQTRGELNLDIDRLLAGIITGQGKVAANINDRQAEASSNKAGALKANLSLAAENLAPLGLGVSGPLAVNFNANGNMRAAQVSLDLNSAALETAAGSLKQLAGSLSGSFKLDDRTGVNAAGELKVKTASGPGGAADIDTAWQVSLPGKGVASPLRAEVRDLTMFAFGVDLSGALSVEQKQNTAEQNSAAGTDNLLWPQGLRLDGGLNAAVRDWTHISALLGMPAQGAPASAEAVFKHNNDIQSAALRLNLPALSLPETGSLTFKNVTADINARFSANDHNLNAHLSSGPGSAGGLAWSGADFRVDGKAQQGTFSLAVKGPAQAEDANKTDLAAAQGQYNLEQKQLTLNALSGRDPSSGLAARLQQPVTLVFADGIEVRGLNLSLQPAGSLKADAVIRPDALKAQAELTDLPLAVINGLAGTTLPPGNLEAHLACQGGRNGPQGDFSLALRLDKPQGSTGAQSASAQPDVSVQASLTRAQGRLWLQGNGAFALLDAAQAQTPHAGNSAAPLSFQIPMRLDPKGLPLPDAAGPLRVKLDWTGQIAPLWSLLPMPDQDLSGLAALNVSAGGSLNAPTFNGGVYIAGGRYEDRDLGIVLTDIALEAEAEKNGQVHVVLALADGKGGTAGLEGRLSPAAAAPLNLRGQLKHLAPLHRDDLDLTITGLLHVQGDLLSPAITSRLLVERGEVNLVSSLGQGAATTLEISDDQEKSAAVRASPTCDIQVEIPRYFFVRGRGLDSEWQGDLQVSGTLAEPEIKGKLKPVRGTFDLLSRTFTFDGGGIEFAGGTKIDPGLNLKLAYDAQNLTAIIRARGTVSKPEIKLESTPPLPQDEVLAQVLFAKSTSDLSRFEALQLANGLRTLMGKGEGLDVLTTMREATGFDVLRLGSSDSEKDARRSDAAGNVGNIPGQTNTPQVSDEESTPTLEAGKYINDSIYVGVEQGISQEDTGVRVEIELFPNVSVQGSTSPDSSKIGAGWKMDY